MAISLGSAAFHGPVVMPAWWQSLTEQQLWDLVAYVRTFTSTPPAGDPSRGAVLYDSYCWTCHGKTGKGDGPIAMTYKPRPHDLTDRAHLSKRTDHDLYNVISRGGGAVERSPTMPGWGACSHPRRYGISSRMSVNSQNSHDLPGLLTWGLFGIDVVGEFGDRWNLASHYPN